MIVWCETPMAGAISDGAGKVVGKSPTGVGGVRLSEDEHTRALEEFFGSDAPGPREQSYDDFLSQASYNRWCRYSAY